MNQLLIFFENTGFNDVLDIIIVSLIVYRFLLIIQGTRATQMLLGLTAVGSLYWLSFSYEFYSLNWILNHFFQYFFVILIILFQEQIRSALVSFGGAKFFQNNSISRHELRMEEVIAGCMALSRESTGALVVFEKNHGLLNYAKTGTELESKIHSDILYAIFQYNSPLHDGAVIISGDYIKAAGCFLPLSKSVEIDRQFGTRHRAALGITEVSDAVVVIVSEESGNINLCYNSVFYKVEDEQGLRKYLRRFLFDNSLSGSMSRSLLRADLGR